MKIDKLIKGLVLLLILSTACQKKDPVEVAPLLKEQILDLSYGTDSLNTLDVYLPDRGGDSTKVILLLHGGSWYEGDKDSLSVLADSLRNKGFAVINLNYRLTHTAKKNLLTNLIQEDIPQAISYVVSNAKKWQIASDKMGMLGASAGGHLALQYTYAYNTDNKIKTVVSLAGPANFTDLRKVGPAQAIVVEWLLGASISANYQAYVTGSPITHVSPLSKPTLIFHGKDDVVVPKEQSMDLQLKLNNVKVKNKLVLYDNEGHDFSNQVGTKANILSQTVIWFRENL